MQNSSSPGKGFVKALKGSLENLTPWYPKTQCSHGNYLCSFNGKHPVGLNQKHHNYH